MLSKQMEIISDSFHQYGILFVLGVILLFIATLNYSSSASPSTSSLQVAEPRLVIQTGHINSVNGIAFSPDRKTFVSACSDSTIKLWDTGTAELLRTFAGHTSEVRSVAFRPNGRVILSGSLDATMTLWRADSDEALATLIGLDKTYWVVVTPDGRFDASTPAEKLLHFVAATSEEKYQVIPFEELRSRYYQAGLLQTLLQGGI